jgi:hypothetical protein
MDVYIPQTDIELKVQIEEVGYTMLYCQYLPSPKYTSNWWVNIDSNSFLINKSTNESIQLINAINIPLHPYKHRFNSLAEKLNFVLVFPMVPNNWLYFDFLEHASQNPLIAHSIKRNNTGIYRIQLK